MRKANLALSLVLCVFGMGYGLLEGAQKGPYMAAFGKDPNSQFPSVQAGVIVADEQYTSEANNPTGLYTNTLRFSEDHGATWKYPVYPTDNGTYNDCGPETATVIRGDVYAVKYLGSANEGNNIFISLATSGIICTSTTGSLWLMASPSKESGYNDEYRPLYDVTYGNGTFVAVGGYGLVKYSLTGSAEGAWKDITVGSDLLNLNSVTFGNGKFVAAGDHSTVWYSPDGINWTQAQLSGEADFYKIIFVQEANQGAGQFIAVASEGTIWYSPDGVLW